MVNVLSGSFIYKYQRIGNTMNITNNNRILFIITSIYKYTNG